MPRQADPNAAVAVLVRVSVETASQLKAIAADQERSMAAVVRDMLARQLHQRDLDRDQLSLEFPTHTEGSSAA